MIITNDGRRKLANSLTTLILEAASASSLEEGEIKESSIHEKVEKCIEDLSTFLAHEIQEGLTKHESGF